jgi:hypothetical protein
MNQSKKLFPSENVEKLITPKGQFSKFDKEIKDGLDTLLDWLESGIRSFSQEQKVKEIRSRFNSYKINKEAPVDLLSELGFVEVRLVKPTKAAITVVDCGNSQLVIRGDDEALRFNNNKVECVSVANSTAVFSFIRPNKTTALTCLPLEVLYVMQGKTPEWFAKQYNKYMF